MSDWDALAADMARIAKDVPRVARQVTRQAGMDALGKVKANASGRPGPRRITGDYTRSWNATFTDETAVVGTNAAQALRLEHGYHGTDSLGRSFNQPAYVHARPAAEWAEGRYVTAMDAAIGDATR